MIRHGAIGTAAVLLLAGCGQSAEERRAEALAQDRTIAPGTYGNISIGRESGDPGGYEISLPQGSDSASAEFAMCAGDCRLFTVQPRRGLGGIAFPLAADAGAPEQLYALQPKDGGIDLVISGEGGEEQAIRLERIDAPLGLAIAKGDSLAR